MKIKKGFRLRSVCGEYVIVAEGKENIDFTNIISMNDTAAYLWENVQDIEDFVVGDLVNLLMKDYDVDENTAEGDVKKLIDKWNAAGLLE